MAKGFVGAPHIALEGYAEFQRTLKRQTGKLPKALGEAHKEVGRFIISKIPPGDPHAVGSGRGAKVRPSATKRDVLLLVGHGGRKARKTTQRKLFGLGKAKYVGMRAAQWGKKEEQPFKSGRPHIIGTVEDHQDEIERKFLEEVANMLDPAFYSAEIRG